MNSVQATAFRKWATSVLKQYMFKAYAVNQNAVTELKYEELKEAKVWESFEKIEVDEDKWAVCSKDTSCHG